MKRNTGYIGLGILLVLVGVLFLLQNFGVFGTFNNLVWIVLFGLAGLAFLAVFVSNTQQWWPVIPGFTLLGLAGTIAVTSQPEAIQRGVINAGTLGGALFLGAIGLSFWVIYLTHREHWWAIIPGGTLITLALVAGLADSLPGEASGGVFFLGLAITFALIYLLPTPHGRMVWAWIPALVLAIMGVMLIGTMGQFINFMWPAILIVLGAFFLYRAFVVRKA